MASVNDIAYREHLKLTSDSGANQVMDKFSLNDLEELSTVIYLGYEDPTGYWLVKKIDSTSGKSFRFATVLNNDAITTYTDAWTGRAALTYGTYSQAF